MGLAATKEDRLAQLKAQVRRPHEASFFFHDPRFGAHAVKILPGEWFVADSDELLITTTLGSCIAACLWDRDRRIGGMNHFMLPDGEGESGRYGSYAMELLINEMLRRGGSRASLEAKVFGGGRVIGGPSTLNVGERNTAFVLDYLRTERIPVVSKDVLDVHARKVCLLPGSGKAMVKRLATTSDSAVVQQERAVVHKPVAAAGGTVDLF